MPTKVAAVSKATFETDDKRGQYARLVVFNHGVKHKLISKDKDVNSVSDADLQKAFKDLTGGNLLDGKDGITLVRALSKNGSTTGNELTVAYAQEVRPFLKRGLLSGSFGRRGSGPREKKEATPATTAGRTGTRKGAAKKTAARSSKRSTPKRSSAKKASAPAPAPEVELSA